MLLLSTDTSGRQGSIALAHGDGRELPKRSRSFLVGGNVFPRKLVPQVAALLAAHGFKQDPLYSHAFAVRSSPGRAHFSWVLRAAGRHQGRSERFCTSLSLRFHCSRALALAGGNAWQSCGQFSTRAAATSILANTKFWRRNAVISERLLRQGGEFLACCCLDRRGSLSDGAWLTRRGRQGFRFSSIEPITAGSIRPAG